MINDPNSGFNNLEPYDPAAPGNDPLEPFDPSLDPLDSPDIERKEVTIDANFNESDHKRDADGKFTSGGTGGRLKSKSKSDKITTSARGANTLKVKGFFNKKALDDHWGSGGKSDHSKQYPNMSKADYVKRAVELAEKPCAKGGIRGYACADGSFSRYDPKTNDYVKAHPVTGIKTMFKPENGAKYFEGRMKKEAEK